MDDGQVDRRCLQYLLVDYFVSSRDVYECTRPGLVEASCVLVVSRPVTDVALFVALSIFELLKPECPCDVFYLFIFSVTPVPAYTRVRS